MQITPISIPATDDVDKLRGSVMLALNRVIGQINRAESQEDNPDALDVAGIIRSAKNELHNTPVHGSKIKGGTLEIAPFASSIRPVLLRATNPTLPNADYPAGTVMYNTTNFTLYKVNAAGDTWVKMINGGTDIQSGTITANEIYANTITAGQIAAGAIHAEELYGGEIKIGGVGGKAGTFGVYNSSDQLVGFIGDAGSTPAYQGAFFTNLRVGPNLATPVVTASVSGVEINGAKLVVSSSSLGLTTTIDPAASGQAIKIVSGTTPYPAINIGTVDGGVPIIELYGALSTMTPYTFISPTMLKTRYGASTPVCSFEVGSASAEMFTYASSSHYVNILCNATSGKINMYGGSYQIDGTDVINSSKQFVGAGVSCTGYGIAAAGFNPYSGGSQYNGLATISQTVLSSTVSYRIRTNSGDLEYSVDNGANWSSAGASGIGIVTSAGGVTITGYGGVITSIA